MTNQPEQELLPPLSETRPAYADWRDWLLGPSPQRLFLPATGLWILGIDWLLFSKEALTLGLAVPVTSILGFLAGSFGAYHLQRHYAMNPKPVALLKSILAGLLVGVPFPLAGTVAGAWILATSGLRDWKSRLISPQPLRR